jgi:type I restriction enzyme R subunit
MNAIGHSERQTQNRVIALFRDELHYRFLGDWSDREGNSNIEEALLAAHLERKGYAPEQISRVLHKLRVEADNPNRNLYENNRQVYGLLRYGVQVRTEAGQLTETVHLVDWQYPEANDFAIAEEVTLRGNRERRPDIVLYLNGIAIGVLELKNSRRSIGEGIRQNLSNQQKEFNEWFFSTVQILFAGNDSEGLQYGANRTEEKYWLKWKEDEEENSRFKLDKYLLKMCRKERLLELIHDFVLFDGGIKKLPRVHQYFGIKAAQEQICQRKGGIIWHTQGSGKSIVMVLLAKWILENNPHARVAIVTDRDELDKQIETVFGDAGETIYRTGSGRDLMHQLAQATPRLLCSLIHKFGRNGGENFAQFIRELEAGPSRVHGELFVFVDECHRTESGKLHRAMKAMLKQAVFIGFTGTPLIKTDKATTLEVFGGQYIHTYKFNEAVEDKVVLDLLYEARDIDQELISPDKVDAWFDAKTRGLNEWQKAALREQWGTMQRVLSSRSRMERVVSDILLDFGTKPRLNENRGTAMLVASSIYEACKYFELFQRTPFKGKCAIVTSYNPQARDITTENTGANSETDREFIYNIYTELLKKAVIALPGKSKTEAYEENAKELFKSQPANMKLLVVVDKLLTGFDAPSCTWLYIDKRMRDHGLFQAICRTNRLDGIDKEFGYIVDYKDLFNQVKDSIEVYTSELDDSDSSGGDPEILMKERLSAGRDRLEKALEALALLCEPVEPPKGELEHIRYFCGNTEIAEDLADREPLRVALYRSTAAAVRAFAMITDELFEAGFSEAEEKRIRNEVERYVKLREIIRNASGETIDLKSYEADMRHLIDTYIRADESRKVSTFDKISLLELIVNSGIASAVESLPEGIRSSRKAVAETIENNVRRKIIKDHLNNPAYYDRMSALLDEIIEARRRNAIEYEEYLRRIAELVGKVQQGMEDGVHEKLKTPGQRALFDNLLLDGDGTELVIADDGTLSPLQERKLQLALMIDTEIKQARMSDWRGNKPREQRIREALFKILKDESEVERLFQIIYQQTEY